jgi:hypothetical protein
VVADEVREEEHAQRQEVTRREAAQRCLQRATERAEDGRNRYRRAEQPTAETGVERSLARDVPAVAEEEPALPTGDLELDCDRDEACRQAHSVRRPRVCVVGEEGTDRRSGERECRKHQ